MNHIDINLAPDYIATASNNGLSLGQIDHLLTLEHGNKTAKDLVRKFCMQSTSDDMQKSGMEFLYMNGFYEDLQKMVDRNKESINYINRQWAEIFQIQMDRRQKRKPPHLFHQQLNNMNTDEPDLRILIELTRVSVYNDQNDFAKIGNFLEIQQNLFDKVEDNFLLTSFNLRMYQLLFIYYWVRNELIMARKYAFRTLNETNSLITKAGLHINLGLTYTFDTYTQGMYHMNEAWKLASENEFTKIFYGLKHHNIPFLSAHFKQVEGITTDDRSEQAHIEIAKGNYAKAIVLLEDIPMNSPFKLYYLGLAKQDKNILLQSYNYFIEKRSDYFFSRLPLNIMRKMN